MFPQMKSTIMLQTTSATNAATVTARLDTLGADFVTLDIVSTTSDNATNNPSVLKLGESDAQTGPYTDVSGFVGDTDFTIPNWHTATADAKPVKMNVDCRHRKRYLQLTISPVTTQSFTVVANMALNESTPRDATGAGALALVGG